MYLLLGMPHAPHICVCENAITRLSFSGRENERRDLSFTLTSVRPKSDRTIEQLVYSSRVLKAK